MRLGGRQEGPGWSRPVKPASVASLITDAGSTSHCGGSRLPVGYCGKVNPKSIGENSEAQVLAVLLKAGEIVLMPFGDNQRYDLVVDRNGVFVRIQVKTGRLKRGSVVFSTASTGSTTGHFQRSSYKGQADYFGVYCPENHQVYMVPVDECGDNECWLRIDPVERNSGKRSRMAKDYEYPMCVTQPVTRPS